VDGEGTIATPGDVPCIRPTDRRPDARTGPHFHRWIDEAGGPDHLLGEDPTRAPELPVSGRRRDVNRLRGASRPHSSNFSGPVVDAGGQGGSHIRPSVALRRKSPLYMAPNWGNGDVRFVDEDDGFVGDIFEQGRRVVRRAGVPSARREINSRWPAHEPVASIISRSNIVPLVRGVGPREACRRGGTVRGAKRSSLAHAFGGLGESRARGSRNANWRRFFTVSSSADFLARQRVEFENGIHLVAEQSHAAQARSSYNAPGKMSMVIAAARGKRAARVNASSVAAKLQCDQTRQQVGALDILAARDRERPCRNRFSTAADAHRCRKTEATMMTSSRSRIARVAGVPACGRSCSLTEESFSI